MRNPFLPSASVGLARAAAALPAPAWADTALARIGVAMIDLYRARAFGRSGRVCLFHPSCSAYARDAFRAEGFRKGAAATHRRLKLCGGGYSLATTLTGQVLLTTRDGSLFTGDQVSPQIQAMLAPPSVSRPLAP